MLLLKKCGRLNSARRVAGARRSIRRVYGFRRSEGIVV